MEIYQMMGTGILLLVGGTIGFIFVKNMASKRQTADAEDPSGQNFNTKKWAIEGVLRMISTAAVVAGGFLLIGAIIHWS